MIHREAKILVFAFAALALTACRGDSTGERLTPKKPPARVAESQNKPDVDGFYLSAEPTFVPVGTQQFVVAHEFKILIHGTSERFAICNSCEKAAIPGAELGVVIERAILYQHALLLKACLTNNTQKAITVAISRTGLCPGIESDSSASLMLTTGPAQTKQDFMEPFSLPRCMLLAANERRVVEYLVPAPFSIEPWSAGLPTILDASTIGRVGLRMMFYLDNRGSASCRISTSTQINVEHRAYPMRPGAKLVSPSPTSPQ